MIGRCLAKEPDDRFHSAHDLGLALEAIAAGSGSSPAVVAPTPLPPTPTALPTEGPCTHTVQPGEWLMSIARKYSISLDQLLAANPPYAQNPNRIIQPGEVLNIPNCGQQAAPTNPPAPAQATAVPPASKAAA